MAVLLALALVIAQAQAQTPSGSLQGPSAAAQFAGQTIVRAEVTIEGQVTTEQMLADLIETRAGSPLSMAAVRETVAHLYSLGRFQEINVTATAVEGGVAIRYEGVPIHSVQKIEFRGNLGLGEGTLRDAVRERFGPTPPALRASAVAEMLQDFYFDRGFLAAAIRPVVEEVHDPEGTILTFEIEAGTRAHVRGVTIDGDPGVPKDKFLREIHADPGRPYQRYDVNQRLDGFIDDLRHRGRFEARGEHRILSQSDDGQSVDLLINIDRGPEVTIRYEGDPLPKDRLDELVPVEREGSVDIDILEDSERRIVQFLNQQGYWKAAARATRREVDGHVEIVFNVQKGRQYRIEGGAQVTGNASVGIEEIRPALARLGADEVFVAGNLDAAASAIRGIYLGKGFAQVKVESAANELNPSDQGEGRVKPVIVITEGPLIRIGDVTFTGNKAISTPNLAKAMSIAPGQPYYEPRVIQEREAILTQYLNLGYASASVTAEAQLPEPSRVDVAFVISEGPQSIVDHVLIVGNVKTDPRVIEREIQVRPGEPLGLEALLETRRRLGGLGLFRRIRITEIQHGESNRRDLLIAVEEAPSTTIGYGGGVELAPRFVSGAEGSAEQRLELAPRGFFEVGRRNIGGKNRSANLYTRLALRSDNDRQTPNEGDAFSFPEYRVVGTYREPRAFNLNADLALTGLVEQGVRSTFNFARRGVSAELHRRLNPQIRVSGRYTFASTRTFDEVLTEEEQATIDRAFPQVRLSAFGGTISRDTRDDPLDPTRGQFMSAEGGIAARGLGGDVGFLKSFTQVQSFHRLPGARNIIFAGRVGVGLADGFPRQAEVTNPDGTVTTQTIEDLPASERFFAGGDTTIRGFPLDGVGAPNTISDDGFPKGGNGLVLFNAELRVPVWKDFGAALFIDTGNVFERVTQMDLGELRAAAGFGLRYRSPFGPLRFDVGFKLDQRPSDQQRYALHFSFGQAF